MVGPAWSRPPTDSYWIPHTSWGFGIFEFLQFAEVRKGERGGKGMGGERERERERQRGQR